MRRGIGPVPELAILLEGLNSANLQIARDVLKMNGIRSWVRDEYASTLLGRPPTGLNPISVKLMVREKDYDRAREVLKKFKPE